MKRLLLLLLCLTTTIYAADIIHRYSFEDDATDSITTNPADGVLSNGVTIVDEQAVFPGGTGSANTNTPLIVFPGNAWQNMNEVSVEMWITVDASVNNNYTPIATFKGSDGAFIAISPIQVQRPTYGGYKDINAGSRICPANVETHFVVTMKGSSMWLYTEGSLFYEGVMNGDFLVPDSPGQECWLGKAHWDHEAAIVCTLNEFRIYDFALSLEDVEENYDEGPDGDPVPEPTLFGSILLALVFMCRRKA
jgi:hypothetical protein